MIIRPATLSNLFLNLSSGAFGLVIVTPGLLAGAGVPETISVVARALLIGIIFLLIAELFGQQETK